jgi:hypothetical protein
VGGNPTVSAELFSILFVVVVFFLFITDDNDKEPSLPLDRKNPFVKALMAKRAEKRNTPKA